MNDSIPPNGKSSLFQGTLVANMSPLELLDQIKKPGEVKLAVTFQKEEGCYLTISAVDQRGLLSLIAGLLAAHGIIISKGDLSTHVVQPPSEPETPSLDGAGRKAPPSPSVPVRKILDTFQVSGEHVNSREFWETFAGELTRLVKALAAGELGQVRQDIIDRVCAAMEKKQGSQEKLLPINIEIDNQTAEEETILLIRSKDTPGFLFSFANALAMLEINIKGGTILTLGAEVQDTFRILDSREVK